MFVSVRDISSISYEIGQKVENCRLMQRCTQIELASKIGLAYQEIKDYENGYIPIPVEVLYVIARVLSVNAVDLLPKPITVREYEDEDEEILYLTKIYENQKLGKIVPSLVRFVHISEKINQEEARLEIAKNLVKEGVSVDIISQATGLSIYEYDSTEREICTDSIYYRIGQRIREWRLIRRYTQKDLADKVGLTLKEIHEYERGYTAITFDKLYEISNALSVNIKVLLPKTRESKKLLSLMDEYGEQESLVKSLSENMKSGKEKVKKTERIKVAKNLAKVGVAIDIIVRASGLTVDECEN
ncbi:helix-turn-helix transcriptional regulator [Wolbachia endosymbiont of Diaphorina citri]|uniref:WO male-killing family protein Wmk n=1 Tax=Wolbachia endosymbiont of Diaphorina citri TaxID=116598 RepID=UPI00155E4C5C|nr:helix-turn-helix transcriptional regulator [Wolbachia endosymbiont of Diaphorina citri]QJT94757.1 helix-turn-helix transcriptional regulator [Wolbachia endosymbiont of Diaphorina citri]QJT94814.1 helix-turn-helix transcriptional regulator [Wolbachia endosymbiont of Diaphorina citri]QJT95996.1 helix-turn-helix transcriptional regulator [Wolbachia endosymbiont of Diaphorina citri]QJT97357.1 helix-turn-helix transcriptional regulator [Wolbachia endosymbiont of Diaphorina citri]QJT97495.1 helix